MQYVRRVYHPGLGLFIGAVIPVAVVETRYEGHQSMSEAEGNWGGVGGGDWGKQGTYGFCQDWRLVEGCGREGMEGGGDCGGIHREIHNEIHNILFYVI